MAADSGEHINLPDIVTADLSIFAAPDGNLMGSDGW